jgi:hypothetical protein
MFWQTDRMQLLLLVIRHKQHVDLSDGITTANVSIMRIPLQPQNVQQSTTIHRTTAALIKAI